MISVLLDDLAFVNADAVSRPVNEELRAVTPVIRRLEQAAGEQLTRQLRVHEPLDVGAAVVTSGGSIAAELMIHAVVSSRTEQVSREGVRRATLSALQRAHDFDVTHLAMAPFGLGAGNLDVGESARAMLGAIAEHRRRRPRPTEITIVVENELEAEAFRAALARAGLGNAGEPST